ncbi:PTS glucose transporter subunit IIABC [Pantoea vagans]|uniref:PTS glucose transporter subunit IIABC n=1 Tax=Pantoea vagans TaxID=470934 RepID=A0A0U3TFG9_9GAMM|nr:PTS glucose transporter subunit IIABC [Pantoea vagans]
MSASRPKMSLWEFFQSLGKTFMLPVALLSFCGILLGIGSSLSSHDVLTLIPMLDQPLLQYLFIWREGIRKRKSTEVATYHGFCQSLTAK